MIVFSDGDQEGTTVSLWLEPFNKRKTLNHYGRFTMLIQLVTPDPLEHSFLFKLRGISLSLNTRGHD